MIIDRNQAGTPRIILTEEDKTTIKEYLDTKREQGIVGIKIRRVVLTSSLMMESREGNHIFTTVPEDEEFPLVNGEILL